MATKIDVHRVITIQGGKMRFIKLKKSADGIPIWLNIDQIVTVEPSSRDTFIRLADGRFNLYVSDSIEDIFKQIG